MTHLLLTNTFEDVAMLIDLDNTGHRDQLRATFTDAANGADVRWDKIYVIDATVDDGTPTLCQVSSSEVKYDEDDYADVTATIHCYTDSHRSHEVTRIGHRIDGRS